MAIKKYILFVSDTAKEDIANAKQYYQSKKSGLEKRFQQAIKKTLIYLQSYPYSCEVKFEDKNDQVRGAIVKDFPFICYYIADSTKKTITLLAVFNTYQNPELLEES